MPEQSLLLTDLYELTMAAGYVRAGLADCTATFELSIRRLPKDRNFVLAAGLPQGVEFLLAACFEPDEIAYLRAQPQFARAPEEFFERLASFRFEGSVWAVPEGTPLFAGEPVMTVRAPLWQAQLAETYLLSTISFQTLIATKAARVAEAASGRAVVDLDDSHIAPAALPAAVRASQMANAVAVTAQAILPQSSAAEIAEFLGADQAVAWIGDISGSHNLADLLDKLGVEL